MSVDLVTADELTWFREQAEGRMKTTGLVQYMVGTTPDSATDADVPVYETAFETLGRVKSSGLALHQSQGGGRTIAETTREWHIPVSKPDPWADPRSAHGVTVLITAVDVTDDPSLLGARLTLSGPAPGSQTTARRLQVTEVVS